MSRSGGTFLRIPTLVDVCLIGTQERCFGCRLWIALSSEFLLGLHTPDELWDIRNWASVTLWVARQPDNCCVPSSVSVPPRLFSEYFAIKYSRKKQRGSHYSCAHFKTIMGKWGGFFSRSLWLIFFFQPSAISEEWTDSYLVKETSMLICC